MHGKTSGPYSAETTDETEGAEMNDRESIQRSALRAVLGHQCGPLARLVIGSLLFSACVPAERETPTVSTNASAEASDQIAAEQIGKAAVGIWEAVGRSDSATILSDYADDAIVLGSGGPMIQGKPAVAAFLQGLFAGNTFKDVKGSVNDIMVSGDLAVETGTYAMTIIPKNGSAVSDTGKYIHVWKKSADGSWKVVRYIATSDTAPR
jgi:ketosteroid isomerase-like protein